MSANPPTTLERLAALVSRDHGVDVAHLAPDTALADVGLDSLAVAELLFAIEDSFHIHLGEVGVEDAPATIGDVVALIEGRLATQP